MTSLTRRRFRAQAGLIAAILTGGIASGGADTLRAEPRADSGISAVRRVNQRVADIDAILPFYRDLLKFKIVYDQVSTNVEELKLIGLPARRARVVALQSPRRDIAGGLLGFVQILDPVTPRDATDPTATSLLLLTDDATALFDRLKRADVVMLSDLVRYKAARTTGTTIAFTVADPAGMRLTFAELAGPVPE